MSDRLFCDQMREVIDINYLETNYLQVFTKRLFDYKDTYGTHPAISTMVTIIRSDLENENETTQKLVRDYFARIQATKDIEDSDFIKNTALDFCKKQKLKEAIIKSAKLLNKSASYDEIRNVVDTALKLGTDNNFGYDYKIDFDKRFEFHARNPVSTGWDEIDNITQGGLGKGEMGVIIAGTSAGKSFALVNLGTAALKNGKTVVHYTMELSDVNVAKRYDACITGILLDELTKNKERVRELLKDIPGRLIIKEYPTRSASVLTLRNHLTKLKNSGEKIDMIIVDYADLMTSAKSSGQRWDDLESIYEDLRGLAQEFQCPIWNVSQVNRNASEADIITMDGIAAAFSKCFVADFICSLARNSSARGGNSARCYIAKNRMGGDGQVFPVYVDLSIAKMQILPRDGETVDSVKENQKATQETDLQAKYLEFKRQMRMKEEK